MYTLSWFDSFSCNLSLKAAWNLLRSRAAELPWTSLIWEPRLACFSWRLLHGKTPIDYLDKHRGNCMASRCYNCLLNEESDLHLFLFCNLAQALWYWIFRLCGIPPPFPLTATAIWGAIFADWDVLGRKCVAAIFFHAISILWILRNDSKHNNRQPSIDRAKLIFVDHIKGVILFLPVVMVSPTLHPILVFLGLA